MKGNLIVVDGSDASGKHTQVERLKDELMKKGYSVKTMDFPRYESFFGKLVSAYLNGDFGDLNNLDPRIPSLFFAMDRFDEKEALNKWLNEGHIVILDRYTESNLGYQAAKIKDDKKREEFIKWIFELENDKLQNLCSLDQTNHILLTRERIFTKKIKSILKMLLNPIWIFQKF